MSMKTRIYYEDAKRLYIDQGLSLDAIVNILKDNVSRKTLFNWKTEHKWDAEAKSRKETNLNIQDNAIDMLNTALQQYQNEHNSKNLKDVETAIKICQKLGIELNVKEKGEDVKRKPPEDIAKAIRNILKIPDKA